MNGFFKKMSGIVAIAGAVATLGVFSFLSCTKDNPTSTKLNYENDIDTWTLTLQVQNGATGVKLANAQVHYIDREGAAIVDSTNAQGLILIDGIAAGAHNFTIVYDSTYTSTVIAAEGTYDAALTENSKLLDQAATVKLFPLSGAISGKVVTKTNKYRVATTATNVLITATWPGNTDMISASPRQFSARTDSTGVFSLTGMPVATGLSLSVARVNVSGIDYQSAALTAPTLVPGNTVPVGTVSMIPIDANLFAAITNYSTLVIATNGSVKLKYTDTVDQASTVILEGATGVSNVPYTATIGGDSIMVTPGVSLVENSQYKLTVYASGKRGGDLAAQTITLTAIGGSKSDVVTSNVLDNNKDPVNGLGLNDTIVFTFRDTLNAGNATVKNGATVLTTTIIRSGKTLRIVPVGAWPSATLTLDVSVTMTSGTSSNFTSTVTTVGAFGIVSSNIMNTTGTAINGITYNSAIRVKVNKPIASATASLSDGAGIVPIVYATAGDSLVVTPLAALLPATAYTLTYSIHNASNEVLSGTPMFTTAATTFYVIANNIQDAATNPNTISLYAPMWFKFSQKLDADVSKITWNPTIAAVDITLYGKITGGNNPNATVRISGDSLIVTPDQRANIEYGKTIGINLTLLDSTGRTLSTGDYIAKAQPNDLFIVAANTLDSLGRVVEGFGLRDTIKLIVSQPIASITAVTAVVGIATPPNLTLADIWLSPSGDTIKFVPPVALGTDATYGIDFDVTLRNGIKQFNFLAVSWKTLKGIKLVSSNDMQNTGTYRAFAVTGDSLVLTFSEAVDTSKAYSLGVVLGGTNLPSPRYTWSNGNKTVTIKQGLTDTLNAKAYNTNPDYTLNGTAEYGVFTFNCTPVVTGVAVTVSSATDWINSRPAVKIFTPVGLELINASYLKNHAVGAAVATNEDVDTILATANIILTFNRAIDSTIIKAGPATKFINIYNDVAGAAIPLEYAISFSADAKTVTINPVDSLAKGAIYRLWIKNLPAVGLKNTTTAEGAYSGASSTVTNVGSGFTGYNSTLVSDNGIRIEKAPTVQSIASVATAIIRDTATGTGYIVSGQRKGVSAAVGNSNGNDNQLYEILTEGNLNQPNALKIMIKEAAWNAAHVDSVAFYQWRARKVSRTGIVSSWYEAAPNAIATGTWLTGWNANNSNSDTLHADINLAGASFASLLTTPDKDGAGGNYSNGDGFFNDSSSIQVQIRATKDLGAAGYEANDLGLWSSSVTFADNIAPCDSDFVWGDHNDAKLTTLVAGGVGIVSNVVWNNGTANDSSKTITITFPEDMDTVIKPTIGFIRGTAVEAAYGSASIPTAPSVAAGDGTSRTQWTNARTYVAFIKLPTVAIYNCAQGYFYNVSVAGMKDASGVVIPSYGSSGNFSDGAVISFGPPFVLKGSACLQGWQH